MQQLSTPARDQSISSSRASLSKTSKWIARHDRRIIKRLGHDIVYIRYFDDMTFSISHRAAQQRRFQSPAQFEQWIRKTLTDALESSSYKLNERKTSSSSLDARRLPSRVLPTTRKRGNVEEFVRIDRRISYERLAVLMLRRTSADLAFERLPAEFTRRRLQIGSDRLEGKPLWRSMERLLGHLWRGHVAATFIGPNDVEFRSGRGPIGRATSGHPLTFFALSRQDAMACT